MRSKNYQDDLLKALRDPDEASEYLNAAIEEKDTRVFLMALRNVIEAAGGIAKISRKARLNRENLYRMLSPKGNPELKSLDAVLETVGLRIAVDIKSRAPHKKHAIAA